MTNSERREGTKQPTNSRGDLDSSRLGVVPSGRGRVREILVGLGKATSVVERSEWSAWSRARRGGGARGALRSACLQQREEIDNKKSRLTVTPSSE